MCFAVDWSFDLVEDAREPCAACLMYIPLLRFVKT